MAPYLGELATAGIVRTNEIQSSFAELRYTFSNGRGYIFEDLVTFHACLFGCENIEFLSGLRTHRNHLNYT
jgi:hypothetical protein